MSSNKILDTSQRVVWILWALFVIEVRHRAWILNIISIRISLSLSRKRRQCILTNATQFTFWVRNAVSPRVLDPWIKQNYRSLDPGFSYQMFYSKAYIQMFLKTGSSHVVCNITKNWICSWEAHIIAKLVEIFPNSCRTWYLIMMSTRAHHWISFPLFM